MPGQQQIERCEDGTIVLHCNEHPDVELGQNLTDIDLQYAVKEHQKALPHRA